MVTLKFQTVFFFQAYTYGLCGPLALSPSAAVVIDSSYNGGFMAGRVVSVLRAKVVRPRNMIIVSIIACITAAVGLCAFGPVDKYMLYFGTGEHIERHKRKIHILGTQYDFFLEKDIGWSTENLIFRLSRRSRFDQVCERRLGLIDRLFPSLFMASKP